jgi:hypothetical protein
VASAALGGILPGWDASADAVKSASRGFGGHAEGRHWTSGFVEEGVHDRLPNLERSFPGNLRKLFRPANGCQGIIGS